MSYGKRNVARRAIAQRKRLPIRALGLMSALGLSVLLLGCSPGISEQGQSAPGASTEQTATAPIGQPQVLPVSAQVAIGDELIQLEVARTPQEQAMGLMYRTELPPDRGMLFAFGLARPVQFWMQDTLIPLDMVFMLDGEVKDIVVSAPPCERQPCPTYGPRVRVNQVIELAGGRAAELGIQVGDRLDIRFLENGSASSSNP